MNLQALNVLVDADHIIFACGFAADEDEELAFVLHSVKLQMERIKDKFPEREWMKVFISGRGNFRDRLAKTKVYKGNRDPALRPQYYDEIRTYLMDVHGAVAVQGMEAEDACGIEQYKHKDKSTVIVAVDKDTLGLPGWNYNPRKDILRYITLPEANEWFWTQVLTGDTTDNIVGLKGVGPKTAEKIIKPCKQVWTEMHKTVLEHYTKQFGKDALTRMTETAHLCWILREEGKGYDGREIPTE